MSAECTANPPPGGEFFLSQNFWVLIRSSGETPKAPFPHAGRAVPGGPSVCTAPFLSAQGPHPHSLL